MNIIYIKLFLSALFWGSSAVATKILLNSLPASQVTFMRFSIAAFLLIFLILFIKKQTIDISIKEHIKLAFLGSIGISLCYYLYVQGLYFSTALNAGLIESTIPLITLLIAVLIKEESFNFLSTIGFVMAYLGVVVIITKLDINVILNSSYNIGDILLLLSTVCFGIYNIMIKKFKFNKITQNSKLFYIFLYGSILLLPWLYSDYQVNKLNLSLSVTEIFLVLILSLGASVLSYIYFNEGIEEIGASKASSFINLVPVITIITAIIILGEHPTNSQLIGIFIILTGVYISQSPKFLNVQIDKLLATQKT